MVAIAGGAAVAISTGVASAGPAPQPLFSGNAWTPGHTQHARVLISAGHESARPYLKVLNLNEACDVGCTRTGHRLSGLLTVTATAPDGSTWSGTLKELDNTAVALTGGDIAAGSDPRRYDLSLTLPQRTGNQGEGLSAAFEMQWGVMDDQGEPVTQVLGEAIHRDGSATAGGQSLGSDLPFTGFSTFMALVASLALISCGVVLLFAARRRAPDRTP